MEHMLKLSTEHEASLRQLKATREDNTLDELIMRAFERGMYDLNYRTKRNKQQWSQYKAWKESQKK